MRVPFLKLLNRLTGFSTPVFGVSWQPSPLDAEVAGRLLGYFEDRRVLFAPEEMEVPHHTVLSVLEIRTALTDALGEVDRDSQLGQSIRAMRAACRAYLDATQSMELETTPYQRLGLWDQWQLGTALGSLRAVFGVHIAQIAVSYGIDVEDQLVTIFPPPEEE